MDTIEQLLENMHNRLPTTKDAFEINRNFDKYIDTTRAICWGLGFEYGDYDPDILTTMIINYWGQK